MTSTALTSRISARSFTVSTRGRRIALSPSGLASMAARAAARAPTGSDLGLGTKGNRLRLGGHGRPRLAIGSQLALRRGVVRGGRSGARLALLVAAARAAAIALGTDPVLGVAAAGSRRPAKGRAGRPRRPGTRRKGGACWAGGRSHQAVRSRAEGARREAALGPVGAGDATRGASAAGGRGAGGDHRAVGARGAGLDGFRPRSTHPGRGPPGPPGWPWSGCCGRNPPGRMGGRGACPGTPG